LKIVIATAGRRYDPTLELIRRLKDISVAEKAECPRFLVLSLIAQPPEVCAAFEKTGAHYLHRPQPDQVVDFVRRLQWQIRADKSLPTIVVKRDSGHVREIVVRNGSACAAALSLGPKLRELVGYLALHRRTESTTRMIADELGICRQSVKEYFLRLRRALEEASQDAGLGLTGSAVFWTRKLSGGYVYGLTANAIIEDLPAYANLGDRNAGPEERLCGVCGIAQDQESLTWSHLGWLCVGCCRDLHDEGEIL
jgi:hypothetical protein